MLHGVTPSGISLHTSDFLLVFLWNLPTFLHDVHKAHLNFAGKHRKAALARIIEYRFSSYPFSVQITNCNCELNYPYLKMGKSWLRNMGSEISCKAISYSCWKTSTCEQQQKQKYNFWVKSEETVNLDLWLSLCRPNIVLRSLALCCAQGFFLLWHNDTCWSYYSLDHSDCSYLDDLNFSRT